MEDWDGHARILLENNAGISSQMGITPRRNGTKVRKLTNLPEKIGFCFDTCHAYAKWFMERG
ncbi:hypothetical protein KHA80_00415 [Anaerobacillus sp. HL2]|nr:hypothetical protein KHA80_00415 [Anaerobacillus sp. HL2]